jgi:hypothetical protein
MVFKKYSDQRFLASAWLYETTEGPGDIFMGYV